MKRDRLEHETQMLAMQERRLQENVAQVRAHIERMYQRCLQELDDTAAYKV